MKVPILLLAVLALAVSATPALAQSLKCVGVEDGEPGSDSYHCTGAYAPAGCFGSYSVHPFYEPHCTGLCTKTLPDGGRQRQVVYGICYDEPPGAAFLP
jgi:hypothetical protein